MNDLRSRSRALAAVPDESAAAEGPSSTPPRVRPEVDDRSGRRMSQRQSIAERARKLEPSGDAEQQTLTVEDQASAAENDHMFRSSRPESESESETALDDTEIDLRDDEDTADGEDAGPSSRPNRRREVAEDDDVPEEDKFPWHFQFDNDEPEELQASSPLLSRAFRATIG